LEHDPTDAETAVLETGVSLDVVYLPAIASLLVVGAIAILSWGGWKLFHALTP
jgi:hypothetical protein